MINNAIAKYNDVKKGLFDTHYDISGKPPTENANSDETPQQGISLIDLDDIAPSSTASTPSIQSSKNAMDELSDIFGSSATISTPPQQPQQQPQQQPARSTPDIFDLLGQPSPSYNNTPSPSLSNQAIPSYSRSPSVSNSIPSYSPSMSHSSAAVQNNNSSNGSYQGSPVLSNANEKTSKVFHDASRY
jgi:hypothetical protein